MNMKDRSGVAISIGDRVRLYDGREGVVSGYAPDETIDGPIEVKVGGRSYPLRLHPTDITKMSATIAIPRLFSIPSFRFSIVDPSSAIGKWSRGATFGKKVQDGAEMDFTPGFLSQMVDFAERRGDEISICQDHKSVYVATTGQPAPSLGFFHGLAVFDNGRLIRHWAFDNAEPPNGTDDDGVPRNGLYCRLGRLTSLGMDPKEGLGNYSSLSPCFKEDSTHEDGTPAPVALFDFAATSMPFQASTPIVFHTASGLRRMEEYGAPPSGAGVTTMAIGPSDVARFNDMYAAGNQEGAAKIVIDHAADLGLDAAALWREPTVDVCSKGRAAMRHRGLMSATLASTTGAGVTTMAGNFKVNDRVTRTGGRGYGPNAASAEGTVAEAGAAPNGDPYWRIRWDSGSTDLVTPGVADSIGLRKMSATPGAPRRFNSNGGSMDPQEMAKRFGFEPDDDDEKKAEKMKKFWADFDGMKGKMDAAKAAAGGAVMDPATMDVDPSNLEQNAAVHLKTGNVHDEGGRKQSRMSAELAAVDESLKAMAVTFGLDPALPRAVLLTSLRNVAKPGPAFDEAAIVARVRAEIKAESEAAAAQRMGAEITERAVKFGMTFTNDGDKAAFVAFAAKSPASAESVIKALPGARIMGRITTGGAPIGHKATESEPERTANGNARIMGMSLSVAAKKLLADGKAPDIGTAQVMAIRANPALASE